MGGTEVMMASGWNLPRNVLVIVEECGYSGIWNECAVQMKNLFHLPPFPLLNMPDLVCRVRASYGLKKASTTRQLQRASVPLPFIHSNADTFVPLPILEANYEACTSPVKEKLVVPDADHGAASAAHPALFWGTVDTFVRKWL